MNHKELTPEAVMIELNRGIDDFERDYTYHGKAVRDGEQP